MNLIITAGTSIKLLARSHYMSCIYETYQHAQCVDLISQKVLPVPAQLCHLEPRRFCSLNICSHAVAHVQDATGGQPELASSLFKNDRGRFAIAHVAGDDDCLE